MSENLNSEDNFKFLKKENTSLYLLCLFTGIVTGIIVSLYRYLLHVAEILRRTYLNFNHLNSPIFLTKAWILFIVCGIIVAVIAKKLPTIGGSGIPQVKAIILRQLTYKNWFTELIGKFIGGLLGIGAGLSLGREGPSVQLGSYVGFGLNRICKTNYIEKKYLVTSGASAGLSAAFGAPLAGAIFSLEELHKYFSAKLLICTLLASTAADFVSRRIFGSGTAFGFTVTYPTDLNPYLQFGLFIIFGIIIAIFGKLFTFTLLKSQDMYKHCSLNKYIKVASVMTTSFILCFILPDVTGGGHSLVEDLVNVKSTIMFLALLFIIKLLFTTFCYATGFPGGIFLPMLVLGAILGKIYALILINIFHVGPEYIPHYMVLGMAGYFVAVVRAPITGVILILEMTGTFEHLLALTTVAVIAYFVTELLKLEPVYDILYKRMEKDVEIHEEDDTNKTIILVPVATESYLDGKKLSEVIWPEGVLVVGIQKDGIEVIPNGSTVIEPGNRLVILMSEKNAILLNNILYEMGTNTEKLK
ncbi:ClC family H(+)/Cl(-) exchange transporter [Cetobacterium sp. SF1]|uniref:ClC family H(+)/Cl(-) exchange transporter n=1 Tax=unclassified Cetobacterium TaxID=2630983 RepID=UPI003CEB7D68